MGELVAHVQGVADWWLGEEPAWEAPEFALDEERILVLDADDPFPEDEWPAYVANDR